MKPNSKFLKALVILEEDGWCKREFTDLRGRHCLMGAAGYASIDATGMMDTLALIIGDALPLSAWAPWPADMCAWNDTPKRKFKDVRELLLAGASLEMSNEI